MTPTLNGFAQGLVDSIAGRAGVAFAVVLPDGRRLRGGAEAPAFTLVLRTEAALLALMTRGHLGLLESYFEQQVDVEGDLGAAFAAGMASGFDDRFNPIGRSRTTCTSGVSPTAAPSRPRPTPVRITAWAKPSTDCGSTSR